jgi:hypothetical protein
MDNVVSFLFYEGHENLDFSVFRTLTQGTVIKNNKTGKSKDHERMANFSPSKLLSLERHPPVDGKNQIL